MLPRPRQLPFPLLAPLHPPQCVRQLPQAAACFHSSSRLYQSDSNFPNHYEALELQLNATSADIKRQFYSLSKLHHPDLARSHPSPSTSTSESAPSPSPTRFHQISEAYRVLANPDSRHRYDREYHRHFPSSSPSSPHRHHHHHSHHATPRHGSYSSHSAHADARPPSGLSKRRSQFRGPPPSFYQQGRYGGAGAGAARQARARAEAEAASSSSSNSSGIGSGFAATDDDVPHFDRADHMRRQEDVASTQWRSRRARGEGFGGGDGEGKGGDTVFNFLLVGGILALIASVPALLSPAGKKGSDKGRDREGKG